MTLSLFFTAIICGPPGKICLFDDSDGMEKENTSLAYHHGRLISLYEGDKPSYLKLFEDGYLQTLG
jgi:hypothetical protein